jgi:hypothetical protein
VPSTVRELVAMRGSATDCDGVVHGVPVHRPSAEHIIVDTPSTLTYCPAQGHTDRGRP